ncbi:hypothetical protein [Salinisphaera hydrothermalis]|uniref:hypothetical protein n=1 Tax=Salinisphaera hydrothermalis TaxID=563188 RepID=UPI003340D2AD
MPNTNDTIAAVRDAYRLIHGYQSAVLQIVDKAKRCFDTPAYWEWQPTNGSQPTQRTCPVANHSPASFEPLLWSEFYYTSRPCTEPLQPGERAVAIFHNGDTEFAQEEGGVYELTSNDKIPLASSTATSELGIAVIVNLAGESLNWQEIYERWSNTDNMYPTLAIGQRPQGYKQAGQMNEWLLERPENIKPGHTLQVVAAVSRMEDMATSGEIDAFLSRLHERVERLS